MEPLYDEPRAPVAPEVVWHPRPKFQDRRWLHILLLALTILTTTEAGAGLYAGFLSVGAERAPALSLAAILLHGLWYSVTIILILGCHELGHYFACRYYGVDASLPFFIPMPILLSGTLGAVIRIREPIPKKRMLFDIGIAGPLAGFVVAVVAVFVGMWLSAVVPETTTLPPGFVNIDTGKPLLYRFAQWVFFPAMPAGYMLNEHPVTFAAWFGMLATALNLFPIGQLDGGHITYAVVGRRSTYVTFAMIGVALVLTYFSISWAVWTALTVGMLIFLGPHHPPVPDEDVPLDRTRIILAVVAVIMFVLCFTPTPIKSIDSFTR